jgi:cation transport regulator ChaC
VFADNPTILYQAADYACGIEPRNAVFAYGSLVSQGTPATLRGWDRTWSVCTDNTTSGRVRYYEPGTRIRPPVQVVFLNLERAAGASVAGVLIPVSAGRLAEIDRREGNYDRVDVTGSVSTRDHVPGVVWAYTGKPDRVERARQAKLAGTARIRREYLDAVREAFGAHDGLLADLERSLTPPPAPIVSLDRVVATG